MQEKNSSVFFEDVYSCQNNLIKVWRLCMTCITLELIEYSKIFPMTLMPLKLTALRTKLKKRLLHS